MSLNTALLDLSDPNTPVWGTNARRMGNGRARLWCGDVNDDGQIKYSGPSNDRDRILLLVGGSVPTNTVAGYHLEDVDLSGVVKYSGPGNDRDRVLGTILPIVTSVRNEQLP